MSLRAKYRPNERVEFEVEGASHKDVFTALAQLDEVFGEPDCGACESSDIYFKVRNSTAKQGKNKGKTFTYFEHVCRSCGCFLPIGQHNNDQGTLFPDRKIANDKGEMVYDKKHRGWRKPALRKDEEEGD
jgi:hypothetical protein